MHTLVVSSANLNLPYKRAFLEGSSGHEDFLNQVGYDGFEMHPLRSRLAAEILAGKRAALDLVTSLHQSFSGSTLRGLAREALPPQPIKPRQRQVAFAAMLPSLSRSLAHLQLYQQRKGEPLRAVLYPNEQQPPSRETIDYRSLAGVFAERLWQPTAEVLQQLNVLHSSTTVTLDGMVRAMPKMGFDKLCIDTFHWVARRNGHVMPPWQEALPFLASRSFISEVHFGPARSDFNDDGTQLRMILKGQIARTKAGKMLLTTAAHLPENQELYVVTELTHAAITELGYQDYQGIHKEVVGAIRGLLA
ncbi:MAG TPA: hypothetical protein VD907_03310 [Verrucomicrobiae bacterium]|nr:hypothetical protein [Verrucomicrobiae bacterium]